MVKILLVLHNLVKKYQLFCFKSMRLLKSHWSNFQCCYLLHLIAIVFETLLVVQTDPTKFRYYVHYTDFNRRMDEWIPFANFREEDGSLPRILKTLADSNNPEKIQTLSDNDVTESGDNKLILNSGVSVKALVTSPLPKTKKARQVTPRNRKRDKTKKANVPTIAAAAPPDVTVLKKNDSVGEFIEELTTDAMDAESLKEHDELTKVKNVGELEIGRYRIDTW